jgi:hypothetical protein
MDSSMSSNIDSETDSEISALDNEDPENQII